MPTRSSLLSRREQVRRWLRIVSSLLILATAGLCLIWRGDTTAMVLAPAVLGGIGFMGTGVFARQGERGFLVWWDLGLGLVLLVTALAVGVFALVLRFRDGGARPLLRRHPPPIPAPPPAPVPGESAPARTAPHPPTGRTPGSGTSSPRGRGKPSSHPPPGPASPPARSSCPPPPSAPPSPSIAGCPPARPGPPPPAAAAPPRSAVPPPLRAR